MNVFLICNKSPFPPREGGPIAMNAVIQGLLDAGHKVKVLAINTNKYNIPPEKIPVSFKEKTNIELVYIDLSIKPFDAFLNLFTQKSYHVQRFISKTFRDKLIGILENNEFDIIQFETLYITPYIDIIRKYSRARIVLRAHNIEHLIWKRIQKQERNPLKKFYYRHLANTLKKYELKSLDRFDGIATITNADKDFFAGHTNTPITDISFGIDLGKIPAPSKDYEYPSLGHIGAMNWIPNLEGIKWFLEKAWPKIHGSFPDLKLYLAGREMPAWIEKAGFPNVVVLGEVEDAYEFMLSKAIMLAPLLSGSGIRIKIIESMALGKAVISTPVGAEGINCENEKHILIAESPEDFHQAVEKCLQSREYTDELGKNARLLIEEDHDNKKIIKKLLAFYHKIL